MSIFYFSYFHEGALFSKSGYLTYGVIAYMICDMVIDAACGGELNYGSDLYNTCISGNYYSRFLLAYSGGSSYAGSF